MNTLGDARRTLSCCGERLASGRVRPVDVLEIAHSGSCIDSAEAGSIE